MWIKNAKQAKFIVKFFFSKRSTSKEGRESKIGGILEWMEDRKQPILKFSDF